MLLPALSKAKGAAKGVKCRSNLKQIGLLVTSYIFESGEYTPGMDFRLNSKGESKYNPDLNIWGGSYWHQSLADANGWSNYNNFNPFFCPDSSQPITGKNREATLDNYGIYDNLTPAMLAFRGAYGGSGSKTGHLRSGTIKHLQKSYSSIGIIFESGAGIWKVKYTSVSLWLGFTPGMGKFKPSISIGDTLLYSKSINDYISGRHGLTQNVLFLDGHVQRYSTAEFLNMCDYAASLNTIMYGEGNTIFHSY